MRLIIKIPNRNRSILFTAPVKPLTMISAAANGFAKYDEYGIKRELGNFP